MIWHWLPSWSHIKSIFPINTSLEYLPTVSWIRFSFSHLHIFGHVIFSSRNILLYLPFCIKPLLRLHYWIMNFSLQGRVDNDATTSNGNFKLFWEKYKLVKKVKDLLPLFAFWVWALIKCHLFLYRFVDIGLIDM